MDMSEEDLRRAARGRLNRGELPRLSPERIWINRGEGDDCSLCGEIIGPSDRQYELEFEMQFGLGRRELVSFRFHTRCHAIWHVERIRW
jgi:hypothetical protein